METSDILPCGSPTTSRDYEKEEDSSVPGTSSEAMTIARVRKAVSTGKVGNVSDTSNGDNDERRVAHLTNAQVVFNRSKWVAMKGDIGG